MCAAARHALHPQRRGTLAPPYKFFVGDDASIVPSAPPPDKVRVGVGVPDDPPAALPKNVIANRRTPVWQSVPLFALSPKNKTQNYAKHKNPKSPCE